MAQIPAAHTVRRLLHEGEHSLFIIVSNILVVFVLKRRRQISAMLSYESLGGGGIEVVVKRLQVFLHWRKGRQSDGPCVGILLVEILLNNFISETKIDYSPITRVQLHKCASLSDLNYICFPHFQKYASLATWQTGLTWVWMRSSRPTRAPGAGVKEGEVLPGAEAGEQQGEGESLRFKLGQH